MAAQTNHARTSLSVIEQFFSREEHWDVQLEVDGRLFKCHRVLLAATSMYFDTLFKSRHFKELYPTPETPIILHELDATAFEDILYFIYTGDVRVDVPNALHLLSLSKFLRLRTDDVKNECIQYLTSRLAETIPSANAIDLFCSARSKEQSVLVETVSAHIFKHLYYFLMDARLTEISLENLKALLVCGKRIIAPLPGSSDVLLAIIYNWVNRNREERSQYRCELMDSVESSKVSSDFRESYEKRLESAVDEAILSKDVQSFSAMRIDTGDIGSNARLSTIISFNVENISELENGQEEFSPAYTISNLSWKVCILREMDCLKVSVECDGTDSTPKWKCYARAIFTIKSLKEGVEDLVGESDCCELSSEIPEYHVACRIAWKLHHLSKPENGFIKDDGSITFDTLLYAGVPCICDPES